jgi:hypothetical protein
LARRGRRAVQPRQKPPLGLSIEPNSANAGDLIADLEAAGFEGIHFSKLDDDACFTIDGRGLRETRIIAFRPSKPSDRAARTILYEGPFRTVEDDLGRTFHRGQWILIDEAGWNRLRSSPISDQFLFGASPKGPSVERQE